MKRVNSEIERLGPEALQNSAESSKLLDWTPRVGGWWRKQSEPDKCGKETWKAKDYSITASELVTYQPWRCVVGIRRKKTLIQGRWTKIYSYPPLIEHKISAADEVIHSQDSTWNTRPAPIIDSAPSACNRTYVTDIPPNHQVNVFLYI